MYGKLFDSMYEGTLYGQWEALVTFQQMIVLCDADGIVDMTPPAIAARTSIPLEIISKGIIILEKPDPYSRTPEQEGRRIELIDAHRPWGWHIVNHTKYQHMQDADTIRAQTRERVRKHRELREKERYGNTSVTGSNGQKRHTDTDTEVNICPILPLVESFSAFWAIFPRKVAKQKAEKAWLKIAPDKALTGEIMVAVERGKAAGVLENDQFTPHAASWLNARRWEDELTAPVENPIFTREGVM